MSTKYEMISKSDNNSLDHLLVINKSDCIYTSCYCEENIWKLCQFVSNYHKNHLNDCFVVFISNDEKTVPIWKQKAGQQEKDYLCVWDYHVIMVVHSAGDRSTTNAQVYDFDTVLSFPDNFRTYSEQTFRSDDSLGVQYRRMFRVIEADIYLTTFASNRSHMRGLDGTYLKAPPNYPCITTKDCAHNLDQFVSMDLSVGFGTVLSLTELNERFTQ